MSTTSDELGAAIAWLGALSAVVDDDDDDPDLVTLLLVEELELIDVLLLRLTSERLDGERRG